MPRPKEADQQAPRSIQVALESRYVDLLHTRFPSVQEIADELLDASQAFRDLVEEYGWCADALDRLSMESVSTPILLEHYTTLRFALERELLQYMVDHSHRDDPC